MDTERRGSRTGIRAVEFYAGIGGLHLALTRSCIQGTVVRAYDWDQTACQVYTANYGANIVRRCDIGQLSATELAEHDATLWLLSPSCQPYTVLNPLAQGAGDPRAKSFIHIIEHVLPELVKMKKEPSHLLVENVAGFEASSTRARVLYVLRKLGYATTEFLLTPLQFGIPNSRLRYYLLAKTEPSASLGSTEDAPIQRHIPGICDEWVDPRTTYGLGESKYVRELTEYLDPDSRPDELCIPDRVLEKWGRLFDIVLPSSRRTCCFTRGYTKLAERAGSVLQTNEDFDTTEVFNRFLAAQKTGDPNAVRILDQLRLRYFSPTELLRLFSFLRCSTSSTAESIYVWPASVSNKTRYKLIGNSINVTVVSELVDYLYRPSRQDVLSEGDCTT